MKDPRGVDYWRTHWYSDVPPGHSPSRTKAGTHRRFGPARRSRAHELVAETLHKLGAEAEFLRSDVRQRGRCAQLG